MIPDEAVEAAARAMAPAIWGPQVWTFVAHGETPAAARERVQRQSLDDARAALEAAAPRMLAAIVSEVKANNDHIKEGGDGYSAGFHYALHCIAPEGESDEQD